MKDYFSQQVPNLPKWNRITPKTSVVPKSFPKTLDSNRVQTAAQETAVVISESDEDLDENEIVHAAVVHHEENATNTTNKKSSGRHRAPEIAIFIEDLE